MPKKAAMIGLVAIWIISRLQAKITWCAAVPAAAAAAGILQFVSPPGSRGIRT